MSIQQAIERAKQLQKERQAAERRSGASGASARRATRPLEPVLVPAERVVQRLECPVLLPNPEISQQNRILLASDRTPQTAPALDAYRIIRTQLRSRATDEGWTRFAINSAGPSEGKSTTALNLALAVAREHKQNVFLLDLDLRNPSIAGYLGLTPPREIGEYLAGSGDPADLVFGIGVDQLYLMAGTQHHEHSTELLSSSRLDHLLGYISTVDPDAWVIADLPPLLSTADALTVAPKMSASILVVSEGRTSREELERAVAMIGEQSIAGVVLNQSRHSSKGYYGHY